jgi:hypothetical protein
MRPTIYPGPVLVVASLIVGCFFPLELIAAVVLPQLMYPKGLGLAVTRRRPAAALDAYVQLAEEAFGNVGYVKGLWTFRHLVPETAGPVAPPVAGATPVADAGPATEPAGQASVGSSAWQ